MYQAAEVYLGGKTNPTTRAFRLRNSDKNFKVTMDKDQQYDDVFEGAQFTWRLVCEEKVNHVPDSSRRAVATEVRSFILTCRLTEKDKLFESYLPYIMERAKVIAAENKPHKIFTLNWNGVHVNLSDVWQSITFVHPLTFDKLALDPLLKKSILDDLDGFVARREYYNRVGKAWKRGYLLYGPPGTGKSSLIAAIANYLKFDVYDLDLTALYDNDDLKKVLVATANKSILVIEDIDCSINLNRSCSNQQKRRQVTLSGLLNFLDGLWSPCGDGRIVIFTTNHKEKLDPALLRPGRMDKHIHLSYCTPPGFRILAFNYLNIKQHPLFENIEKLIKQVPVTAADVAEKLIKTDKSDAVLQQLVDFLEAKKNERQAAGTEKNRKIRKTKSKGRR